MNKIMKLFVSVFLILTVAVVTPTNHVHDENCGYDPSTETGCIYEIDPCLLPPDDLDPNN